MNQAKPAMPLYAIDKLIEETRRLAAEFRRTTGTMLPVSGEIARFDVSHHLDLTLNDKASNGVDAVGKNKQDGLKVQIKGRVIGDSVKSGHRIGQLNTDGDWDVTVLSLMDNDFQPLEMYQATRAKIQQTLSDPSSSKNKRGAISVARFKIIGELVWTQEQGTDI